MVRTTMPSSTGRHALRKNLREARHDGDRQESAADNFNDNTHNNGHGGLSEERMSGGNRWATFASKGNSFGDNDDDDVKEPNVPRRLSSSLMNDLADINSELARFLLYDNTDEHDMGLFGNIGNMLQNNAMMKSMRNMTTRFVTGEDELNQTGSLGTNKSWFYSLALEPFEVRRDRIIMLAEAYAIFGALFLAGTWVLYEWGSGYGYGGCRWEETAYCHPAVDRAFEAVMSMAITANLFQAMYASFLWLMSILFSGSQRNWVYGCRHLLVLCHLLLVSIFILTILGVGLGLWSKLAPYWPELAVALTFLLVVVLYGISSAAFLVAEEAPLEYYHFPLWFKWFIFPYPMLRRGGRQKIREAAENRAREMKERAYKEKETNTKSQSSRRSVSKTSVGAVLRRAATAIGRGNIDISKYEERLENEWYTESSELRSMDVDTLGRIFQMNVRYMPRRLAEEVYNQLHQELMTARNSHSIGTGTIKNDSREHWVSWDQDQDEVSWDQNEHSD